MQLPIFAILALAASPALAAPADGVSSSLEKRGVVTVYSDTGSVQVQVPDTTTSRNAVGPALHAAISAVRKIIQNEVKNDIHRRQDFTQNVVARICSVDSSDNVVMSNVGYDFHGTLTDKETTSYNAKIGASVTYDILEFKAGTFVLKGDGGFENWAYCVKRNSCKVNGGTITCTA